MRVPKRPKLYHITHGANLRSIIEAGGLLADAGDAPGRPTKVGMSEVVARRKQLPVPTHPSTCVGDYVPFYFCPRSVMLYVIYRRNHPSLTYAPGQEPIVHLEADLHSVATWAMSEQVPWAFTLGNATESRAEFRSRLSELGEVNWTAIEADQWSGELKGPKQAEFLVHRHLPWSLVERIGVMSVRVERRVAEIVGDSRRLRVEVRREWYY
ncbi:MAG: DUF4433 domain-containing protein [Spirochaetaceae bacterium]|nr:DUF4433 domain-containing protein [Spirochaetaceae bacterium]